MTIEELRDYCLSLPMVTEDFPFDETTLVFRVMGKIFAMVDLENTLHPFARQAQLFRGSEEAAEEDKTGTPRTACSGISGRGHRKDITRERRHRGWPVPPPRWGGRDGQEKSAERSLRRSLSQKAA